MSGWVSQCGQSVYQQTLFCADKSQTSHSMKSLGSFLKPKTEVNGVSYRELQLLATKQNRHKYIKKKHAEKHIIVPISFSSNVGGKN